MFFYRPSGNQPKHPETSLAIPAMWLAIAIFVFGVALNWQKQPVNAMDSKMTDEKLPATKPSASPSPEAKTLSAPETVRINESFGRLPLAFEENRGQAPDSAHFVARGAGYHIALSSTETVLTLGGSASPKQLGVTDQRRNSASVLPKEKQEKLTLKFVGANSNPVKTGLEELPGKSNYLIGNDPAKWRKDVRNFAKVKYSSVYSGIDAVFYGNQRSLEYDFVVAPGASPDKIELQYEGQQRLQITREGDLLLSLDTLQQPRQYKPIAYQEVNGVRQTVTCHYVLTKKGTIKLKVGNFDKSKSLIIDPTIVYSSYMYGVVTKLTVGVDGSIYVLGTAQSNNSLTTVNPLQATFGGGNTDIFIQKLNAAGNTMLYSTYLGGNDLDYAWGLYVDVFGQIYVAGDTSSTNFPTANAFQPNRAGTSDAFVCKINAAGNGLIYSTYLGGTGGDGATGLAVDVNGKAYLIGTTNSTNFPTVTPLQTAGELFIAVFNASGNALAYSTYLGWNGQDEAYTIAADNAGNCYFAGTTWSTNLPTVNAFQPTRLDTNTTDAFYGKLNTTGSGLVYLSYLGGDNEDYPNAITVDGAGSAYIVGSTKSLNFPTVNAYQPNKAVNNPGDTTLYFDGFVTKVGPTGATLGYSTYLGGCRRDEAYAVAVDANNSAWVTGATNSWWTTNGAPGFPRVNATQNNLNSNYFDAFVTKFNSNGSALSFSTFLGGFLSDAGYAIAVDANNDAYVGGLASEPFPLVNPIQTTPSSGFLTKFGGFNALSIGGQVLLGTQGTSNVTMTLSGSQSGTVQTDTTGFYQLSGLDAGGTYTITPSKPGYSFVPASKTFTGLASSQIFNFAVLTYSISGRVMDFSAIGKAGVTMTLSGTQSGTQQTDVNGDYGFTNLIAGGTFTITPSKPDYALNYFFFPIDSTYPNLSGDYFFEDYFYYTAAGITVNAIADAYVQDGASANVNFGTANPLTLRTDSVANSGNNRDVYFKFDLSPITQSITNVTLRFAAQLSAAGSVNTAVHSVATTSWVESGPGSINWSNRPVISASPLIFTATAVDSTALTYYDVDVSNYVRNEKLAGRNIITLALHNPSASTINTLVNSREASVGKPTLFVEVGQSSNTPPAVTLTSPPDGGIFTGPANISIAANASDPDGLVTKVDFYVGTELINTDTVSPYLFDWNNVPGGSYAVRAVATDNGGLTATSTVANIRVVSSNIAPTVTMTAPLNNSTFAADSTIRLSAPASDSDGVLNKVEFFRGATLIGTVTDPGSTSPVYNFDWTNVPAGAHSITAKATDNNNVVTTSNAITVNVVRQTGYNPTADAYVRDGATATTNFGTAVELHSQANATAGNQRETHLKFDLTTATGITTAKIRLFGRLSDATATNIPAAVYSVATTTWSETIVNWNTKPAAGVTALTSATILDNTNRWYEWDVTAYVLAEKAAGRNTVAFALKHTTNSANFAIFNSREATGNRPQMVVNTTAASSVLFVVGAALNAAETALQTRMQNLGYTVTTVTSSASLNASSANGKSLVVISSTVTSANVTNKFRHTPVPLLNWKADLQDDQGMTGTAATEFGTTATQTQINITNASHALAAGLAAGLTSVVSPASTLTWGKPNANAAKIATQNGDATKVMLYGYDTDVAMSSIAAPMRRVGFFLFDTNGNTLTANGNALFDAAIKWLGGTTITPNVTALSPTLGPVGTAVTVSGVNFGATQGTSTITFNGRPATVTSWAMTRIVATVPVYATTGTVAVKVNGVAGSGLIFAVGVTDSDGDGLPDSWETTYFGNLTQGAAGDPDGDGLTNLQEFQLGRNPTKGAIADNGINVNLKVYTPLANP